MKKHLHHIVVLLAFVLITVFFCGPMFFSGKELRQSDINNWKGMSKEIIDFKEETGEQTMWTNSMFGGMPAYQISAVYAANLVQYIDKVISLGLPTPANYIFLLMAGFYFLLITLKIDYKLSIVGAVAFAFSSYFILFVVTGHNSKAHAVAYMAPVIAGIFMTYRGKLLAGMAITALSLALELYANHLQITYYLMLVVVMLVVAEFYKAVKEKRIAKFVKGSALLGVAAMLAVLSNITNLWATQEYGKYSTRGPSELTSNLEDQTTGLDRSYITDWSFGIDESFTLLIPDFKGGASEPINKNNKDALKEVNSNFRQYVSGFGAYFGEQPFTGGPSYCGAIMVMLFLIGAFVLKGPIKWWLVSATVLSLMLSWGRNLMWFTNFFLDYVPGYDKFRAVTTTIVIAQFAIPLLGVLLLNRMINETNFFQENRKRIMYSMGFVLAITFLIVLSPGSFTDFHTQREVDQIMQSVKDQQNPQQLVDDFFVQVDLAREHIVKSDALRSFLFMLLAAALLWTFLKYRYRKEFLEFGILVLVLFDLFSVDRRYMSAEDFIKKSANAIPFPEREADRMISRDTTSYRVLNLASNIFNDASTAYYHQSIGGYHGAKLKRYKELIDYSLTPEIASITRVLQNQDSTRDRILYSQPVINMLNTKYIIYNPDAPPLRNRGALGNAWFVSDMQFVPNADSEIVAIRNFNPESTAVIDERFRSLFEGFKFTSDSSATIVQTSYKPNNLVYQTSSSSDQLAVFSEIYYDKGWNVTIDGQPASYARADYVLRAMRIPAGQHTIEWRFEPQVIRVGEKIAFTGSLFVLLLCAGAIYASLRNPSTTPPTKGD